MRNRETQYRGRGDLAVPQDLHAEWEAKLNMPADIGEDKGKRALQRELGNRAEDRTTRNILSEMERYYASQPPGDYGDHQTAADRFADEFSEERLSDEELRNIEAQVVLVKNRAISIKRELQSRHVGGRVLERKLAEGLKTAFPLFDESAIEAIVVQVLFGNLSEVS